MHFLSTTYFWLATSVLLLALLYFWRRHSKQVKVPAVFLWDVKEEQPNAGKSLRIVRLPLTYYLEALAILLLAVAAAMPFLLRKDEYPPLAVVMDNSFSMTAVGHNKLSFKELCIKDLDRELARFPGRKVHWVLAGSAPQKLEGGQADVVSQWTCSSISSDMASALQMARQLCVGGEILVLTDRPPAEKGIKDIRWISHGQSLANVGFVNARRTGANVLLELFNSSASEARVVVREMETGGSIAPLNVTVQPTEVRKIDFKLQNADSMAKFSLEAQNDAIALDNTAVLLPESRPPLAYRIGNGLSEQQEALLRRTLMRNQDFVSVGDRELTICGQDDQPGNFHRLVWHGGGKALSSAPITVRPDYPALLKGLSFADLLWPADIGLVLPGTVLVYQGDASLLSIERRGAFMDIHINLHESAGNLPRHVFWPSFFWNLSDFLRSLRHAPDRVNVRCGDMIKVPNPMKNRIAADGHELRNNYPDAFVIFDEPGVHRINDWSIAVNPFDKAESDLSDAATCDIRPDASYNPIAHSVRRQVAFAFILIALAVLAVHWHVALGRR